METGRFIDVEGARLWAIIQGAGRPVVLCHGGPGLWDDQAAVAAMIDDLHTTIRYDQRGGGRSDNTGPYSVESAADDLDAIRRAFGFESWTVYGHSWGVSLAIAYAYKYAISLDAVILVGGVGIEAGWQSEYHKTKADRLTSEEQSRLSDLTQMKSFAPEQFLSLQDEYLDLS
jgi:proline iminopeptidase